MDEEAIVRITETLESIRDAIWLIGGLTICMTILVGVAFVFYTITKD